MDREWKRARKKPVEVEFREVDGDVELIHTLEGDLEAHKSKSFIIRGVKGEIYPIGKEIFYKTYDVIPKPKRGEGGRKDEERT